MGFIDWILNIFWNRGKDVEPDPEPEPEPESKEDYYNNKYPKSNITYRREDKINRYLIDVRLFCNPINFKLVKVHGENDDAIANAGLRHVIQNVAYTKDSTQFKDGEYWAFGYETAKNRKGDCEDGAILLYDTLRHSGIPAWKLRLSAGYVKYGGGKTGHAYLTYYVESQDKWVILDWCYWPNNKPVAERPHYRDEEKYLDVWFSFNEEFSWTKGLNTAAKRLLRP
jgi:hypothetical protein